METRIINALNAHARAAENITARKDVLISIAQKCISCLSGGGKIIFCGNGGSAADSQHLAAELVGRFKKEKKPLPALALSVNTSILTAIGNDYGFDRVFEDQVRALASQKDILIGISTSGNSENVIRAVRQAREMGMTTVGFLGKNGGRMKKLVDYPLLIACDDTARIQEMHIFAGHVLCELIEGELCE